MRVRVYVYEHGPSVRRRRRNYIIKTDGDGEKRRSGLVNRTKSYIQSSNVVRTMFKDLHTHTYIHARVR